MVQRIFDIVLGFNVDPDKARKATQSIDQMTEHMEKLEDQVTRLNQAEGALNDINSRLAATGAVIFAPLVLSATRYVDAVGKAEQTSRRWIAANEKLSASTVKIGREATGALVPYLETLADIVDMASKIDPGIISAGVNIGGGLILVGAVGLLSANVIKFISATKDLTASMIALRAQGGLTGGLINAGVGITALGVGSALGVGAVNLAGAATGNQRLKEYGFDDAARTLMQAFVAALATGAEILQGTATILLTINRELGFAKIDLKTALAELVDNIRIAAANLVLGISNLEIAGKRIGDFLGIDETGLRQNIQDLERGKENRRVLSNAYEIQNNGTRELTERGRIQQSFDERAAAVQAFDGMVDTALLKVADFFGLIESEYEQTLQYSEEALNKFADFQEGMLDAETEFNENRVEQTTEFEKEALKAQEDFDRQRLESQDDFNRQRQQQEDDFNQRQLEAQQDFEKKQRESVNDFNREQLNAHSEFIESQQQLEIESEQARLDALENFNRQRERAEQDHRDRLRGAAARLDATAVLEELRSHSREQSRAGEDFSREQSEREQQAQERIASERTEFEQLQREREQQFRERQTNERQQFSEAQAKQQNQFEEQQRRTDDNFQRQLDRQQQHFDREQQTRESEFRQRLSQERKNFLELQQERRDEFRQQLEEQEMFQNAESAARERHYLDLQRQYEAFLGGGRLPNRPGQKNIIPAFAEGGLSSGGLAMLHAGEGVLNRQSTDMMMRAVGSFNQSRIQNFINNRSVGDLNNSIQFGGTALSESQIERAMERSMIRLLEQV